MPEDMEPAEWERELICIPPNTPVSWTAYDPPTFLEWVVGVPSSRTQREVDFASGVWESEGGFITETQEENMEDEVDRCEDCGEEATHTDVFGDHWCGDHDRACCDCGIRRGGTRHLSHYRVNDGWACNDCYRTCYDCGEPGTLDSLTYLGGWDGFYYCDDCRGYCELCDSERPTSHLDENGYCSECRDERRGIRGYGQTSPTLWLGGPVPKNERGKNLGYYVGWEDEISASHRADATPIHDFSQHRFGYSDVFDCKEDSSVEGFEIATQPMTPEFFEHAPWEDFFDLLNAEYPIRGEEPIEHGLHVHIGRQAFERDDVAIAAYSYLLGQGDHLERISRREPYHYCEKVAKPVSAAVVQKGNVDGRMGRQWSRLRNSGIYAIRGAINLTNPRTIEIRSFRATRSANELRDAVRVTYVAAEYIRYLRNRGMGNLNQKVLHWNEFSRWVANEYPAAFASIVGLEQKGSNREVNPRQMW